MPTNNLELLAPAGSIDALKAAIANGADAVYLGAAAFGARSTAGFDEESLREALKLAHLHRKKIYVTVNILIKERELNDVRQTLSLLSSLGADAVLLQDLGLLKICREEFPELPIHASTQMALHNAEGARLLQSLGAKRVVLARECSLDEIRKAAQVGVEIEAFCHGALCVGCSGQCLFSSMIGGRSGNRGRCAQPCRLPYAYQGVSGAWLSPRDLCARDELKLMSDAGVYSFKIEGRLKRPEYVAVVTRAYRNALDSILEGRFSPADEDEKEGLTQIFSRGGFTLGYPGEKRDAAIIDPTRVTPIGITIGKVKKVYQKGGALLADVPLSKPLHNGDGLEIGRQEIRYSGPEVPAGQTAVLRLRDQVKIGEKVRRTEDESQLAAARETFEGEALNQALPIPFDAVLTAYPEKEISLAVTDKESTVAVKGDPVQPAQKKALDEDAARNAFSKTGGTPFVLHQLTVKTAGAFVPASALNALRREALEKLTEARIAAQPREGSPAAHFDIPKRDIHAPRLIVKTGNLDEVPSLLQAGADEALYLPQDFREECLLPALQSNLFSKGKVRLCLPSQLSENAQKRLESLCNERSIPVCLTTPNQLFGGFQYGDMAGEGIPVMNGESIRMLSYLGCNSVTLSRELSKADIQELPAGICEMILPVYGRTRLMILNHCPMRTKMGLQLHREQCELCAQGKGAKGTMLKDRMGAEYPLMPLRMPEGCQIELMADKPLHLSGKLNGMEHFSWLLTFTDETMEERLRITAHYAALLRGETPQPLNIKGSLGRFQDGVL
ncbi:MAG: U32 family peptidase [Clostridia bacterium]|nr:U32 family peptidase [Clostridia bacterium]